MSKQIRLLQIWGKFKSEKVLVALYVLFDNSVNFLMFIFNSSLEVWIILSIIKKNCGGLESNPRQLVSEASVLTTLLYSAPSITAETKMTSEKMFLIPGQ